MKEACNCQPKNNLWISKKRRYSIDVVFSFRLLTTLTTEIIKICKAQYGTTV